MLSRADDRNGRLATGIATGSGSYKFDPLLNDCSLFRGSPRKVSLDARAAGINFRSDIRWQPDPSPPNGQKSRSTCGTQATPRTCRGCKMR